ncbi:ABC transporter ATP-binding protein [Cellulomonas xiejunii]|uniref:ABC transporter ATP-binding protein n=1 Tax=Cellulomonas xiejunii TaxID=2968083 RepID=A0ABY5KL31_9CELL|nr:ABC transporter ATP-binding protein [Cellulomonas xiejunii]MCC2313134.1 ABC transporter ATP-binding protein [Cellulomonas xiejunii]MCC2319835.1 ABC transporter ATP-binding protein [Cellulomonas xiejunii]UUI70166.1 ABC transporter ATP-binding protein [Cellulomonas xiejunii]
MPVEDVVARARNGLAQIPRVPGAPKPDALLVADGVRRSFGGVNAVDVEHVEIQKHVITALIGPNGAGKTTFFNLMTGFDKPDTGSWVFDGTPLAGVAASRVAKSGMVRTFQLTKALARMTVLDNMRLGARDQPGEGLFTALVKPLWAPRERAITEKAMTLLERFKLDTKKDDFAGSLSGGQRKLLEMARALMSDPTLVMLDEPMAGVNPALTQSLLGHITDLRDSGTTVLFVEHDMHMVRHISDWVVVMAQGKVVAEGPPSEVMADQAVIDAYLGAHHDTDLGDDALLDEGGVIDAEAEAEADAELSPTTKAEEKAP